MSELNKKIDELLANVKKQQEEQVLLELKSKENKGWSTCCRYEMQSGGIKTIQTSNEDTLVEIMADLILSQDYKNKAYEQLNISKICEEHNGSSVVDWKSDIHKRLNSIRLKAQTLKLNKAAKSLGEILTDEQKRELKYAEILKSLD